MQLSDKVFGWCWCKYIDEWSYRFLYWKQKAFDFVMSQVLYIERMFYTAGFVHMWHSFHWNRFSKLRRY